MPKEASEPKKNVGRKACTKKDNAAQGISIPMTLNCDSCTASAILPLFTEMVKLLIEKEPAKKSAAMGLAKRGGKSKADPATVKQLQADIADADSDESEITDSGDAEDPLSELSYPPMQPRSGRGRKEAPGPLRRRSAGVRYVPYLNHSPRSSSTCVCCASRDSMIAAKPKLCVKPVGDPINQSVDCLDARIVKFVSAQQAALEALLAVRAGFARIPQNGCQISYNFQDAWNEAVQQHQKEELLSLRQLQLPKQQQQQQQQQHLQDLQILQVLQDLQKLQQEQQFQQQHKRPHPQEQQQYQQQNQQLQQQRLQRERQQHIYDLQDLLHLQQLHQDLQNQEQNRPLLPQRQFLELKNVTSDLQITPNDAQPDSEIDNSSGTSVSANFMRAMSQSTISGEPSAELDSANI